MVLKHINTLQITYVCNRLTVRCVHPSVGRSVLHSLITLLEATYAVYTALFINILYTRYLSASLPLKNRFLLHQQKGRNGSESPYSVHPLKSCLPPPSTIHAPRKTTFCSFLGFLQSSFSTRLEISPRPTFLLPPVFTSDINCFSFCKILRLSF